jgi:hypothetical protein
MNPLLSALVAAGIITPDDADRINRQLDPTAARAWAEQQLAVAMQAGLSDQQARLIEAVRRNGGTLSPAQLDAFWTAEDDRLWEVLRPTLADITAESAIAMAIQLGAEGDMWRVVNERMLSWVDTYYTSANAVAVGSIPNLNLTSRTDFARVFAQWERGQLEQTNRTGMPRLIEALEPVFGPERAELIAPTETTRILQASRQAAADESDNLQIAEWQTAADEAVCPQCGPMHTRQRDKAAATYPGGQLPPPAHPRCRCQEIFLTKVVADLPSPPEETYQFSPQAYAARQRDLAQRRQEAQDGD